MSQSNIARQLAQNQAGILHAGVDLALEKNVVVVVNEKAERLDHFSFPQDRGGYEYFLRRLEGLRQKHQAAKVVVAMEPTNYFWKLLARELEEKQHSYRLVKALELSFGCISNPQAQGIIKIPEKGTKTSYLYPLKLVL